MGLSAFEPPDDPSIPDSEFLYRTIHPVFYAEGGRVSSAAFLNRRDPHVSVDRASLSTPEESLARHPKHTGVVQVLTGFVRNDLKLGAASDPLPENSAHALIVGAAQSKQIARQLARASTSVLGPAT
jgi:hypothetical protein